MPGKLEYLIFFHLIFFTACVSEQPEIRAVCETSEIGDYILKWETFPKSDGTVKIYEVYNDASKPKTFIAERPIRDGITTIFRNKSADRRYFELKFDNEYSFFVAERSIKTNNIHNLRDLGGYYSTGKRQLKWGEIYRSGTLYLARQNDFEKLNSLNIKTVVDCRREQEVNKYPPNYRAQQIFFLPMRGVDVDVFEEKVTKQEMMRGDVLIMQQDLYVDLLTKNTDYYIQLFDLLLDEKKYPILIYCSLGKDRVGIASALILLALDISREQVNQDYMLSNSYIGFNKLVVNANNLSYKSQEALTALLGTNEKTLDYTLNTLIKNYGSIDNYFEKELKLTKERRERLKDLLLY